MKQYILLVLLFLGIGLTTVQAQQNYVTTIGGRFGNPSALTIKHFTGEKFAFEGLIGYNFSRGITFTALYEFHIAVGFNGAIYAGLGGSVGGKLDVFSTAADGIIGYEYTFNATPINIGIDWKPNYRFDKDSPGFNYNQAALSLRYVLFQ